MINKLVSKLRLPRFVEVISGVLLVFLVGLRYSAYPQPQGKYVLSYLIPYQPLLTLVVIFLVLVAARLLAGKPKDYAPFVTKVLIKFSRKHKVRQL